MCCCTHPAIQKITPPFLQSFQVGNSCSKQELCAHRLSDRAKRAQRMQSSINIISTAQAVVDSLSKDKQQISQSLSRVEISNIFHPAECWTQVTSWHVDSAFNCKWFWTDTHRSHPTDYSRNTFIAINHHHHNSMANVSSQGSFPVQHPEQGGTFLLVITKSPQDPVQGMGSSICLSMSCHREDFHIRAVHGTH